MLVRWRRSGLLVPMLMTLAFLPVLVGLGTWQLNRKAWKDGLQARIDSRVVAPPIALDPTLYSGRGADSGIGDMEYLRVKANGRYLHEVERLVYWPSKSGPGYLVHTPLLLTGGGTVIVNRGWVPDTLKSAAARSGGQVAGVVEVVGLVRGAEVPGRFTPANNPSANAWYWRDLAAMAAAIPASTVSQPVLPFFLDAEAEPTNPGGWPRGGTTTLVLPNRHLEYALTWYGFAATLMVIFLVYSRGRWC